MSDPPDGYGPRVEEAPTPFHALAPDEVHGWLADLLPTEPGALVMDVGAGMGRDAAWMAGRGLQVIAVEPSAPMLAGERTGLDDVFAAVEMQQMRLRADQGVGVWEGVG
jgi:protein-L-isoaspartate O-methyltransferase